MSVQSQMLNQKILESFEAAFPDKGTAKILVTALEVFSRKGLVAAKIKDIAQTAGFSQGFVYNYFPSKDDIFIRLVDIASECAGIMVKNVSELEGTPLDKIRWLTEALLLDDGAVMRHWQLIMLQASTSEAVPEKAKKISEEKMLQPIRYLIPILMEGQAGGLFVKEDPAMLALTYFSIVQGLGITKLQGGTDLPFPSVDRILSFLKYESEGAL
ncbi:MAG: TetR/AcrR family transcriptional regulator [Ruminiclostridium sp.]|nr:TetR/AcrR family transcriptional regulator [Ruminiclostridium sp.]